MLHIEITSAQVSDVNKAMSNAIKALGLRVVDADCVITCPEPGRCWVKRLGQTSVTAYG